MKILDTKAALLAAMMTSATACGDTAAGGAAGGADAGPVGGDGPTGGTGGEGGAQTGGTGGEGGAQTGGTGGQGGAAVACDVLPGRLVDGAPATPPPAPRPTVDLVQDCTAPADLNDFPSPLGFTPHGQMVRASDNLDLSCGPNGLDAVVAFTAPAAGRWTLSTGDFDGGAQALAGLVLSSACGDPETILGCDFAAGTSAVAVELATGQTIYALVENLLTTPVTLSAVLDRGPLSAGDVCDVRGLAGRSAPGLACAGAAADGGPRRCAPAHAPRLDRARASIESGVLVVDVAGRDPDQDIVGVTLAFRDAADAYLRLDAGGPATFTVDAMLDSLESAGDVFAGRAALVEFPPEASVVEISVRDSAGEESLILDRPLGPAARAAEGEACDLTLGFMRCAPGLVCDRVAGAAPVCAVPRAACAPGVSPVDLSGAADGCVALAGGFESAADVIEACDARPDRDVAFALPGRRGEVYGVAVASPSGHPLKVAVRRDCAADDPALTTHCAAHVPPASEAAWPTVVPVTFEAAETAFVFVSAAEPAGYTLAAFYGLQAIDEDVVRLDPTTLSLMGADTFAILLDLGLGRAFLEETEIVELTLVDATDLRSAPVRIETPRPPPPPPVDHVPAVSAANVYWNDADPQDVLVGVVVSGVDVDGDPVGVGIAFVGADGEPLFVAPGEPLTFDAELGLDGFTLDEAGGFSTRFLFRLGDPEVAGLPPLAGLDLDVFDVAGNRSPARRALFEAPPELDAGALCEVTTTLGACPAGTLYLEQPDRRGRCGLAEVECPAGGPAPVVLNLHPAGAGFRYAGDTTAAPSMSAGGCGGDGANEVFHRFTAPTTARYRFSTEASTGRDTVLYVRSHCGSSAPDHELGCDDDLSAGVLNGRVDVDLTVGDTVFVVVDGSTWDTVDNGPYVLTATAVAPESVPPACPAAYGELVDVNAFAQSDAFVVRGTTAGAGSHTDGACGGEGIDDVAHAFTAPSAGRYAFTTQAADNRDTVLYARRTCDDRGLASAVGCNDDAGPHLASRLEISLAAGEVLYVFVDGAGPSPDDTNVGAYTLTVSRIADACPASYGEVVDLNAHPLGDAWLYRGDNAAAELETAGTCGPGFGRERAHGFTAAEAGRYVFEVDGVAPRALTAYLRGNCDGRGPADELACAAEASPTGTARQLVVDLARGQRVYLFVDSADRLPGSSGPYFVTVDRLRNGDPDGFGVPRACPRAWRVRDLALDPNGEYSAAGSGLGELDGVVVGTCGGAGPESVFQFAPALPGRYGIAAVSFELDPIIVHVRSFCGVADPAVELACASAVGPGPVASEVTVDLVAGQPAYVFVDSEVGAPGEFFLVARRLDD